MREEPSERKQEVLRLLSDVASQASDVEMYGQGVVRAARQTRDIVVPLRELVTEIPDGMLVADEWDRQIEGLRAWQGIAAKIQLSVNLASSFVAATEAVASTCSTSVLVGASMSDVTGVVVETAQARLRQTLDRSQLLEEARSSMRRLGLQSRGGGRTPMDLLEEACAALERPALPEGRATSVLLPLRECILACFAELIRRRPEQEPAPKKLEALGRQCARADLSQAHFERLEADGEMLMKTLSSAKQADLPREKVIQVFSSGLVFLNAAMNSIDEGRLKPGPTEK